MIPLRAATGSLLAECLPVQRPEVRKGWAQLHVPAEALEAGPVPQSLFDEVHMLLARLPCGRRPDVDPRSASTLSTGDVDLHAFAMVAARMREVL